MCQYMKRYKQLWNKYARYPEKRKSFWIYIWTVRSPKWWDRRGIENYDDVSMELKIFGKKGYLELDLIVRAMKIPCIGGATFNTIKTTKLENIEMTNKIGGKKYLFWGMN